MHKVIGSLGFFSCWFKILVFLEELEHKFGWFFMRDYVTYTEEPNKKNLLHEVPDICSELFDVGIIQCKTRVDKALWSFHITGVDKLNYCIITRGGFRGWCGGRSPPSLFFSSHLFFLQSLWRTTNCVIRSWTDH